MTGPGEHGSRASSRDLRSDQNDATVTASFPAISDDTGPGGHADWSGLAGSGSSGGGSAPSRPEPSSARDHRTEVVPPVAGGRPTGAPGGPGSSGLGASSFASAPGGLPPRPGQAAAGAGAATATAARPTARPSARAAQAARPARRAQLTLRRFNVWSVFKFSCLLAIALWLVWMIAVGVLYGVLDTSGIIGSLNDVWQQLTGDVAIRAGRVLGIAAIVGVVNIVLFIALSSLFAVIYNLVSDFVGGVEVTLSERE